MEEPPMIKKNISITLSDCSLEHTLLLNEIYCKPQIFIGLTSYLMSLPPIFVVLNKF